MNERKLSEFMKGINEGTFVVIDEAYYEYVTARDFPDTIPLLKKHKNLLILRTFSKAYGLASFRVGYAIGNEEIIEKLNVVRLPFNVSSLAQKQQELHGRMTNFYKRLFAQIEKV